MVQEDVSCERRLQGLVSDILRKLRDNDKSLQVLGGIDGEIAISARRVCLTYHALHRLPGIRRAPQVIFARYAADPRHGDPDSQGITLSGFRCLLENELEVSVGIACTRTFKPNMPVCICVHACNMCTLSRQMNVARMHTYAHVHTCTANSAYLSARTPLAYSPAHRTRPHWIS